MVPKKNITFTAHVQSSISLNVGVLGIRRHVLSVANSSVIRLNCAYVARCCVVLFAYGSLCNWSCVEFFVLAFVHFILILNLTFDCLI